MLLRAGILERKAAKPQIEKQLTRRWKPSPSANAGPTRLRRAEASSGSLAKLGGQGIKELHTHGDSPRRDAKMSSRDDR